MKISWGTGIVITFVIFIGLLSWAVTVSFKADHYLVTEDYYEQELDYGQRMEEIENLNTLGSEFSIKQSTSGIEINFPKHWSSKDVKGHVQMYKPDNIKLDFKEAIHIENHQQIIPLSKLSQGKWKVKISFKRNNTSYFKEDVFFF